MYSLNGKVVIVTGASSGIGKATVHAFAAQGAKVVLVARWANVLAEVKEELEQYEQPTLVVPTDVVQEEALQNLYHTVVQTFGTIDVLVNNAGISIGGAFQEQDAATIRKMVEINVYAPMRLTQLVLPLMLERQQGHIVNVGSVAGLVPSPGQVAYTPTRSAAISFSHALRRELAGSGVNVSMVLPGWTRTAMLEKMDLAKARSAQALSPFMTLDDPAVPARAIVDAVVHHRYRVRLGGCHFLLGDVMQRLSPKLIDWYLRIFVDAEKVVQVMKDLG